MSSGRGLLDQFPRLSAFDPGAAGEGGLDPLGLSAIAERIADLAVPGLRARMSLPRFVTLSAVGAVACQSMHDLTGGQGKTTIDIAFEWLVVESLVRYPGDRRTDGLPGSQKAARAKATDSRLGRSSYLSGPRVFGFTGVYRPFSRDAGVLTQDDLPGVNAGRLIHAWEHDSGLDGFLGGDPGTRGGKLRKDIAEACRNSLEKGECTAPPNGQLMRDLADHLAPREAKANERRALRALVATGQHETRNELAAALMKSPPPEKETQRDLATHLRDGASSSTRRVLQASIDYENVATALDHQFRRILGHVTRHSGSAIDRSVVLQAPGLAELAGGISDLVQLANEALEELGDTGLASETKQAFRTFEVPLTPDALLQAIVDRHEEVQARRKNLSWFDRVAGKWVVRHPYRNQGQNLDDAVWAHPMRLVTLARFLRETR